MVSEYLECVVLAVLHALSGVGLLSSVFVSPGSS